MEYKKTKRTNQYLFEGSRHQAKRQKINVNADCKGILISTLSPKRMTVGIKEFLNFLKVHFPSEAGEAPVKQQKEEQSQKEDKLNGEQAEPEGQPGRMEKQLNDEIEKENMEYNRFAPLRNIVKNFTFIKFNNISEKNPSDIVQKIFILAHNRKEKYILRHLCKIIPLDCICKPHLSPFIKAILPLVKKNFPDGTCVQESFTVGHLSKMMNVSAEEGEKGEGEKEEGEKDQGEKKEDQTKEDQTKEDKTKEDQTKEDQTKEDKTKEDQTKEIHAKEETTPSENKHTAGKKVSWALIYKCSNTKTLMKKDVLTVLDKCIGSNYSVNLGTPDLAVVVHVTEIMCGISIVRGYEKTRKFNIAAFNEDS
ncbi:hypothetical protein C922_04968 [Plasmodium inui San Antonio 1]|uniref:THUMP domain-containing protein n=1 Tax=Plasmodium inui San Antonio 1 TaxID=1237626 RepID=W6ZV32_9APIC|nr:hypothetical protein C922_04968 [Plasmodium inui San Antonio 1]EUD64622.1 hypothetical protein C922_04968 [Plasmodium inui San Antonio 1]